MRYRLLYPVEQAMVDYMYRSITDYIFQQVWEGDLHGTVSESEPWPEILEQIWRKHNEGRRPDGKINRSMCIGDIIVLEGHGMWTVTQIGFRRLAEGELLMVRCVSSIGLHIF